MENSATQQTGGNGPVDRTYVLLGASNLDLSLGLLVHALSDEAGEENVVQVLAASGHGRSYGRTSQVLARRLPGILECGLWEQLEQLPQGQEVKAIVTDIGNDLVYGSREKIVLGWVEECLRRLQQYDAETVMTTLPRERLLRLPEWQFHLFQKMLFPTGQSRRHEMIEKVTFLNRELEKLSKRYGVSLQEQPLEWFGVDPIHFKRNKRADVWKILCTNWSGFNAESLNWNQRSRRIHGKLIQQERWWFKQLQNNPQPCYCVPNLSVFLY